MRGSHLGETIAGAGRRWLRDACAPMSAREITVSKIYPVHIVREIDRRWQRLFPIAGSREAQNDTMEAIAAGTVSSSAPLCPMELTTKAAASRTAASPSRRLPR
jgi:hypothetical protein